MFRTDKNAEVQLNIPEEINFSKNLFIRLSLGFFFAKQVLKLSIAAEINPPTMAREVKYKVRESIFIVYPFVCVNRGSSATWLFSNSIGLAVVGAETET